MVRYILNSPILNIVTMCVATLVIGGCADNSAKNEDSSGTDKLFTARKSDFVVTTLLTGTVNAKKKYKLAMEAGITTNLNWIVDENTKVKAGEPVIKFEKEDLIQKIEDLKIDVDSSEKGLLIERERKLILKSENISIIREINDNVTSAEGALSRYVKYDGKKQKNGKELTVTNAKKSYNDAKVAELAKSDVISNKIYDNDAAKDADELKLATLEQATITKENSYDNSVLDLKIFKRFTHPNMLTALKNKLDQSKLNLEKAKISTASSMVQKDNTIFKLVKKDKKLKKDLLKNEGYLPLLDVVAPVDGIVVYGDMDRRRNKIEIKIGMQVKRKQVLVTIPDMNNLVIDFELPEQFRHKVKNEAKVLISPMSIPSLKIPGKVAEIAMVPVNQISWDASSPKIYKSKITLDIQKKELVSGMNVQVEVITAIVKKSINVPVEAIFEEDGEYFVYKKGVLKTTKQVVALGKSNESYVDVVKGLNEGDVVYLYRPFAQESSD